MVHLVVQLPPQRKAKTVMSHGLARLVATERVLYLENNKPAAPSSAGTSGVFARRQENPAKRIECNRPPSTAPTTPLPLLHRVFGEFLDTCNSGNVTAEDHDFALNLSRAMSSFYGVEFSRAEKVRQIFEQYGLFFLRSKISGTSYETDGDIALNGFRYALLEVKNEICSSGAEPYAQAALYYQEATREHAGKLAHSVLPCLIVLVFGLSRFLLLDRLKVPESRTGSFL
jgi:hypothetical protein